MPKRRRVTVKLAEVTPNLLTRQEPKGECDINKIVANARRGIAPTWVNRREPIYADVSNVPRDLSEAYLKIEAAEEAFMSLPAEVRTEIDNDPRNLEDWLLAAKNRPLAEKYGLLKARPAERDETQPEAKEKPQAKGKAASAADPT